MRAFTCTEVRPIQAGLCIAETTSRKQGDCMNRKLAAGLAATAGTLLAVTACSSSSSSSSSTPATTSSSASASASAPASPSAAASTVPLSGSLDFNQAKLATLDAALKKALAGKSLSKVNIAMVVNV